MTHAALVRSPNTSLPMFPFLFGNASETIDNLVGTLCQSPSVSVISDPSTLGNTQHLGTEEKLAEAIAEFKSTTSLISMHIGSEFRESLFRQIDSLLDFEEWDVDDIPPTMATSVTFIRLLLALGTSRRPGLGIGGNGSLFASWIFGKNRLIVECLENDKVKWVLSREMEGDLERAAGDNNILRMKDVLAPYQPDIWFRNAQ